MFQNPAVLYSTRIQHGIQTLTLVHYLLCAARRKIKRRFWVVLSLLKTYNLEDTIPLSCFNVKRFVNNLHADKPQKTCYEIALSILTRTSLRSISLLFSSRTGFLFLKSGIIFKIFMLMGRS